MGKQALDVIFKGRLLLDIRTAILTTYEAFQNAKFPKRKELVPSETKWDQRLFWYSGSFTQRSNQALHFSNFVRSLSKTTSFILLGVHRHLLYNFFQAPKFLKGKFAIWTIFWQRQWVIEKKLRKKKRKWPLQLLWCKTPFSNSFQKPPYQERGTLANEATLKKIFCLHCYFL